MGNVAASVRCDAALVQKGQMATAVRHDLSLKALPPCCMSQTSFGFAGTLVFGSKREAPRQVSHNDCHTCLAR